MESNTKLVWRILSDVDDDDAVTLEAREEDMLNFDDSLCVMWSSVFFHCDNTVSITFMVSDLFVVDDRFSVSGNGYVYTVRKKEVNDEG